MAWLDISTAPRDGTPILAKGVDEDGGRWVYVVVWMNYWRDEDGFWCEALGEQFAEFKPTHWMPVPGDD